MTLHSAAHGWARLYEYGAGQYPGSGGGIAPAVDSIAMTEETVFDLASVTKVMATTMAAMLLAEEGRLDISEPVSTYLPEFVGDGRERITVEDLLTHRSGLPQWLPVYYHAGGPGEAWAYLRTVAPTWPVGEERHYSDLGFMILGRVIEAVSGETLDAFLDTRLYRPLGLSHTGFTPRATIPVDDRHAATSHGNPFERRMVHDPDFGYRIDGDPDAWGGWRRYTLTAEVNDGNAFHAFGGVAGHAGLFSSAGELGVLLQLLLDQGEAEGRRFLSPETVERFLTPVVPGQALGWQVPAGAPDGSFAHTGFTGTWVLGVPGMDLAAVLLTNRQNLGVDADTRYVDVAPLQAELTGILLGGGG